MATTNNNILSIASYPKFTANQALTDVQLNSVLTYMNEQDRLTRTNLIGTGILCGFQVQTILKSATVERTSITVTEGCGITSDGRLAILENITTTHFHPVATGIRLPGITDFSDVVELVTSGSSNASPLDNDPKTGRPLDLSDKVIVLLLQEDEQPYDSCAQNCDELGGKINISPKILLVPRLKMNDAVRTGYKLSATDNLDDIFNGKYSLPDLFIERFGFSSTARSAEEGNLGQTEASVNLTLVTNTDIFKSRYEEICRTAIVRIAAAYRLAYKVITSVFSHRNYSPTTFNGLQEILQNKLNEFVEPATGKEICGIQYFYDYLKDLILAYEEFTTVAFDLMEDCCPDNARFPAFLMLGEAIAPQTTGNPSVYRTYFAQPPVYNGNNLRMKEVNLLYERMQLLPTSFNIPQDSILKIIPGKTSFVSLSERPLPFYYPPVSSNAKPLSLLWNYNFSRKNRTYNIPSYHRTATPAGTGRDYNQPLLYNIDESSFFRIEGHVGKVAANCLETINNLRQNFNLPFDVIKLKLGDSASPTDIQFDYHLEDLQVIYTNLRNNLLCVLKEMEGSAKLQEILVEKLQDFGFDSFKKEYDNIFPENKSEKLHDCSLPAFEAVSVAFNKRIREMKEQQLFHKFAEQHPGMEHMGGVGKGGTFVLVYDEKPLSQEEIDSQIDTSVLGMASNFSRELLEKVKNELAALPVQTVVGDFCLPYIFSSKFPPLNYVIAKPRPILLLDKSAFCANDANEYPFFIHPTGGVVTGLTSGILKKPDGFYFKPALSDIVSGTVNFVYTVDDTIDVLPVTILPVPDAGFTGLDERYCISPLRNLRVELKPNVEGGTFSSDKEGAIITETGKTYFDTAIAEPGVPVTITYTLQDSETTCANFATQTVTVFLAPDTVFVLSGASPYCVNGDAVIITPHTPGGDIKALVGGIDTPGIINKTGDIFEFNPGAVNTGSGTPVDVTIVYTAESNGCSSSSETVVTVLPLANAGFNRLNETYCQGHADIQLVPQTPGGDFQANKAGAVIPDGNGGMLLHLDAVTPGESVTISYTLTASANSCSNSSSQTISILPLPDARFELPKTACSNVEIPIVPNTPGGTFITKIDNQVVTGLISGPLPGADNIYNFHPANIQFTGTSVVIIVRYSLKGLPCDNSLEKSITITRAPEASFAVAIGSFTTTDFDIRITGIKPTSTATSDTSYLWDFGDGTIESVKPKGSVLQRTILRSKVGDTGSLVTVKLTVTKGGCSSDTVSQTYTVPPEPIG